MGIPCFYRWLVTKYPKSVANAVQEPTTDASSPNPNGFEFDNLYLDMNGIIHPCFDPDDLNGLHPTFYEDVFNTVFEYVDRLFNIVRPRKLLYFAIDGVAPRAKLNQQRAGRYRKAKDKEISDCEEERLRSEYAKAGIKLLPKVKSEVDDPNIISPGTKFMYEFSKALDCYIQTRLKENPAWKNLKVILSDVNVPGEGEHKMVSFIRSQRRLPDYDFNTRHCIHGLDADLIMLALATHELHISILREDVLATSIKDSDVSCKPFPVRKSCAYEFVHMWILREYLGLDMQPIDVPEGFKFDAKRAVDDFVFICFFVGNDFLPHLPSLGIREGALELLMTVYKRDFKIFGGYLVDAERVNEPNGAYLNLERVEKFIHSLSSSEDQILLKRTGLHENYMRRALNELSLSRNNDAEAMEIPYADNNDIIKNTKEFNEELSRRLKENGDLSKTGLFPEDKIKYGAPGWKDRYHQQKFGFKDHLDFKNINETVVKYTEGLCWVFLYYYSGVPSWSWLYPYHYGPCLSDLEGISQLRVKFEEGVPFEPFDQLLAVLPPTSVEILPKAYRKLMTDESSDLAPFYPREFEVDMDGKRQTWQGLCKLPFIDETLLLSSTKKAKEELTDYEARLNSLSTDLLLVRAFSNFGSQLLSKILQDPSGVNGVAGFVNLIVHALDSSIEENRILCVRFGLPKPRIQAHARIVDNIDYPPRTVFGFDLKESVLWHEQGGRRVHRVQEIEPSRLASSGSREGLYNHPNRSKHMENSNRISPPVNYRGSVRPERRMQAPPRSQIWPSHDAGSSERW